MIWGQLKELTLLHLGSNDLSGNIPPELANLTRLQELYLDYNKLSGQVPLELNNLTELNRRSLRGNRLSGTIEPKTMPATGGALAQTTSPWLLIGLGGLLTIIGGIIQMVNVRIANVQMTNNK